MPHADAIHYEVADFMQTPFDDESFGAVTAISVNEHGLNSRRLLQLDGDEKAIRWGGKDDTFAWMALRKFR